MAVLQRQERINSVHVLEISLLVYKLKTRSKRLEMERTSDIGVYELLNCVINFYNSCITQAFYLCQNQE